MATKADSAEQYVAHIETAVSFARSLYFPADVDERRERAMILARDLGYGLSAYGDDEIKRVITSTYSRVLVRNTFDSVGTPVNANEWVDEIRRGIERGRGTGWPST